MHPERANVAPATCLPRLGANPNQGMRPAELATKEADVLDVYYRRGGGDPIPISQAPTHHIVRALEHGFRWSGLFGRSEEDIRLRLEIELLIRQKGW